MFFHGFSSFSGNKSARTPTQARMQPEPAQRVQPAPAPSKKPSRLQSILRTLRLSRPGPKVILAPGLVVGNVTDALKPG